MFALKTLVLSCLVFYEVFSQEVDPVVEVSGGFIQGRTISTHYDEETTDKKQLVNSFYGIPFGAPPVGNLRFEKPLPAAPWDDILNTTSLNGLPTACMQSPGGVLRYTHPLFDNIGEDCLNLNLFAPFDMSPTETYPVMVYFFGGAFSAGANIQYPGHFYAARDVIAVTVNYRLGIFGFFNTYPLDTSVGDPYGNAGLYDQALALQWIQENIAQFGGDPGRVTIFGQSAGAASSGIHTVSPLSKGLFHGVIEQSGCDTNFWSINRPAQTPWEYPKQAAERVGCSSVDAAEMIQCLRTIDPQTLRENSGVSCTPGHFCLGHAPVIDGPSGFLPEDPLDIRANGEHSQVPIFGGFNKEDGSLYVLAYIPEALDGGFNRSEFLTLLYDRFVNIWEASLTPKQTEDVYKAVDFFYTPWPYIEDEDLNRKAFVDMTTDAPFGFPVDRQLKLNSRESPSYMYVFGYRSTNASTGIFEDTEWAGVPHSGEIPYTFGWALLPKSQEVRRDARMFVDIVPWNEEDFAYAEFTMDLFANFAKFYNPTPEPVEAPLGHGPITLPQLTEDELNFIYIHRDEVEARINYRQKENAFFREYVSYITDRELYSEDASSSKLPKKGLDSGIIQAAFDRVFHHTLTDDYPDISELEDIDF